MPSCRSTDARAYWTTAARRNIRSASVFDVWAARTVGREATLGNLGGGSDHVAFYTHAGIPSAGVSSGNPGGVYHSNYDNFHWFENFGDTAFVFGPMIAEVNGRVALRFANADVLPYDVVRYATDIRTHVETLEAVAEQRAVQVDLSALVASTADLETAATDLAAARDAWVASGNVDAERARAVNRAMIQLEKAWLDDEGLQGRAWSRSLYVSPDPFSGYASWMLPGIRYEIETDDPGEVPEWEAKYLRAVGTLAERMREITAMIEDG